jgi:hypothetical protein
VPNAPYAGNFLLQHCTCTHADQLFGVAYQKTGWQNRVATYCCVHLCQCRADAVCHAFDDSSAAMQRPPLPGLAVHQVQQGEAAEWGDRGSVAVAAIGAEGQGAQ